LTAGLLLVGRVLVEIGGGLEVNRSAYSPPAAMSWL
jgi:hypothetical protein